MRHVLAVLAVVALVAPVYAATDYFAVTGDGSFDTYHNSDMSACEGYVSNGAGGAARLGYTKQGHGFLAWDAKNAAGVQSTSAGDLSGQSMAQFLSQNSGPAYLWINLNTASLVGSYVLETVRCGNTGVIREDGGTGTGNTYTTPAAGIAGSAQPWAWSAGTPPYVVNGIINNPAGAGEAWKAAGTTSSHYAGGSFVAGADIQWGGSAKLGFDGTMAANGGEAWALACLLGMDWSQGGTSIARANSAGQIVNTDPTNTTTIMLAADKYVGNTAPRPGAAAGNWYKIPLSSALLTSLATDAQTKALLFNNWFAGTSSSGGNPSFVTSNQGSGTGKAFIEITPEPATMILLAIGGLALVRRRP